MGIQFPELAGIREGARFLATESIIMACDGKGKAAVGNAALGFRLADHAGSDGTLISNLVQRANNSITFNALQRIMIISRGDPRVAKEVAQKIEQNWQIPPLAPTINRDVGMGLSELEFTRRNGFAATLSISGSDTSALRELSHLQKHRWNETINANGTYLLTQTQRMAEAADLPYQNALAKEKIISADIDRDGAPRAKTPIPWEEEQQIADHLIAHILLMDATPLVTRKATEAALAGVTRTTASLFEYRGVHSAFPASLSDLPTPVPTDPFDLKPLRYRREGKGFIVYSVGPTMKFDGSVEQEKAGREQKHTETVFRYAAP